MDSREHDEGHIPQLDMPDTSTKVPMAQARKKTRENLESDDTDAKNISQTLPSNSQVEQEHIGKSRQHTKCRRATPGENPVEQMEPKLLSDVDFKNAGNRLCSLNRYEEAITYYDKAILKNPSMAIYYSNRALCHFKLQGYDNTILDCRKALELEPNLIKANFFLGQAYGETGNFDDALKHLERAHELAKERKMNFGDDIAHQIRVVKRLRWVKFDDETSKFEDELHSYLDRLIEKDKQEQLSRLSEKAQAPKATSLWPSGASTSSMQQQQHHDSILSPSMEQLQNESQAIKLRCDNYTEKLATMFNDLKLNRRRRDVPEYLCGKISFEIMRDPVITPSGITYDRQDIEEHLMRVGYFDPITRQPLRSNQLISNLAMKEVVDAYLNENEWALYH